MIAVLQILFVLVLNVSVDYFYLKYICTRAEEIINRVTQHDTAVDTNRRIQCAIPVYIALSSGLYFNVLQYTDDNFWEAFLLGGQFGMVVFTVYDFTNMASFYNWELLFALQDIIFGTISFAFYAGFVSFIDHITEELPRNYIANT